MHFIIDHRWVSIDRSDSIFSVYFDNVMRILYVVTLVANYCNHEQYYIVPQYQSYHILWYKSDTVTYYAMIMHICMQPF